MTKRIAAALTACLVLLAGCSLTTRDNSSPEQGPEESPAQGEGASAAGENLLEQMDALYAQLDDSRKPEQDYSMITYEYDAQTMPPQLALDEEEAYEIAALVMNYLYFGGNILEDFDEIDNIYRPAMIQTALYRTTPIVYDWQYSMGDGQYEYLGPFDNHVISALMKHEVEEGRALSDFVYADSVEKNIRQLFGDEVDFYHMDLDPYYYYAREGVYARAGDFGGPMYPYPQITAYERTEDGLTCELTLVHSLDRETPMNAGGEDLTAENFEEATASLAQYRYTFATAPDGHYILASLKTVRPAVEEPPAD